jgi:hypothetical protein
MEKAYSWSDFLFFHVLVFLLLELIFQLQCVVFLDLINTLNNLLFLLLSRFDLHSHVLFS